MEVDTIKVKRLALDKGLTITALAKKAGVGSATVYSFVENKRSFTTKVINKIARALGVKPSELLR